MTANTEGIESEIDLIPGVLKLWSNRQRIPNFPLACNRISELPTIRVDGQKGGINLAYNVRSPQGNKQIPHGKLYRCDASNKVSIEVPVSRISKVECSYTYEPGLAVLEVNPTYHKLGRMTLGNMHSVGWLLRDLLNIQLLLKHFALLHAAAIQSDAACVVVVGLSNTGKSTTSFNLTLNGLCKLFGDDLVATDGRNIYACPYTATNVSPGELSDMGSRSSQWLFRNIPFYGNFGPTKRIPICSHVGEQKMAQPTPATHVVFLRRSSTCSTSPIETAAAHSLLTASNRTEFTFMNSPLFCAFDYLQGTNQVRDAIDNERDTFSELLDSTECLLIEGDMPYFRKVVTSLVDTE